MIDVAVVGAAGYAGIELVRLIEAHPEFRLRIATSAAEAGRRIDDLYPQLAGVSVEFTDPDPAVLAGAVEIAFLAVPHTAAMAIAPELLDAGLTVVDASADFRLGNPALYEEWYGVEHTAPALLEQAVYGLPELDRSRLPQAKLIACPGCYPTATLLAAAPAVESGLVSGWLAVDAKSGVSGAGRTPTEDTHFPRANEAVTPYKVASHRHIPEIEQELSRLAGLSVTITFTPHLVPMTRGLLSTVYARLAEGVSADTVVDAYNERYAGEPFVVVHPDGRMPSTAEVKGSNRAHIGLVVDQRSGVLVSVCAIDNLVKGTSGQAVQCANIALGIEETAGLTAPAPVV